MCKFEVAYKRHIVMNYRYEFFVSAKYIIIYNNKIKVIDKYRKNDTINSY